MWKNYLKITLRNLIKNRWFSLINITGLTIGLIGSLIIYIYISQELSFDNFHLDGDRMYRITRTSENASGLDYESSVPYPLIGALREDFTQFEAVTLFHDDDDALISVGTDKFLVDKVLFADSTFFDVFSFEVLEGNAKEALGQPNYVLLTRSLADKLFPEGGYMGRKLKVRNTLEVEVAGLLADVPANSHVRFDMLISYPTFSSEYFGLTITEWSMSAAGYAYVKLNHNSHEKDVLTGFDQLVEKHYTQDAVERQRKFYLQPLAEVHFNQLWQTPTPVNTKTLWVLGVIGSFILIIGCVNFVNLTTALAVKKAKEVGVRKALGAGRSQLFWQHMTDTLVITTISALLAVALTERLLPLFNDYFDKHLEMNLLQDIRLLVFVWGVVAIVTVLAGFYPSIVLAGYNPIKALKSTIHSQDGSALFLRKGLITLQFIISQVLIIATIIIAVQMKYFVSKPLGFDKDAVVTVDIPENDSNTLQRLRDQLLANSAVQNVSFSLAGPIDDSTIETSYWAAEEGKDQQYNVEIKAVDYYYLDTYGLNLKYGRWFTPSEDNAARKAFEEDDFKDGAISYILNESAVKRLGYANVEEAVGKAIVTGVGGIRSEIVGVVEDFHTGSFHDEIGPVILLHFPQFYYTAGIKIQTENLHIALDHIEQTYSNMFPENLYDYNFIDDTIAEFYEEEHKTFQLFKIFSVISIFISCLGLLGMISFIVNQKTKEVGVRKVMGASVHHILLMFSREFMLLVGIAFLAAAPLAWYAMNQWLSDFAYKIDMQAWFYLAAIVISAVVTFMTISWQSYRAAIANPVEALRDE